MSFSIVVLNGNLGVMIYFGVLFSCFMFCGVCWMTVGCWHLWCTRGRPNENHQDQERLLNQAMVGVHIARGERQAAQELQPPVSMDNIPLT